MSFYIGSSKCNCFHSFRESVAIYIGLSELIPGCPIEHFVIIGLHGMSCVVSYRVVSCRVVSSRLVSSRLVSSRLVSSRLVSSRLVSYRIVSYRIVSYRIVLYYIVLFYCLVLYCLGCYVSVTASYDEKSSLHNCSRAK